MFALDDPKAGNRLEPKADLADVESPEVVGKVKGDFGFDESDSLEPEAAPSNVVLAVGSVCD